MLKEIYAFPAKGGGIVPIVSIDGWNKMLIRHPEFDGIQFDFAETPEGELVSCTATVHMKNRSHPVVITEYLGECKRNTDPWNNMPHRMLRNRTLCQAAREQAAVAQAQTARVEDKAAEVAYVESRPIAATRAAGEVVKWDWEITVTNRFELARCHPDCVKIEALLTPIKAALNAGRTVVGIEAKKIKVADVRATTRRAIEV